MSSPQDPPQDSSESTCPAPYEEMSSEDTTEQCDCDCDCDSHSDSGSNSYSDSGVQSPSSDEWPAKILPGCSKGKDRKKPWTMSASMMQAYQALKGPGCENDDPLLSWIAKQDKDDLEKRGAIGMLTGIKKSIKEQFAWKSHGPSAFEEDDRQSVFQYRRPKIKHITLDDSFDPDLLKLIYENRAKEDDGWREVASDVSDDEGGPEDGRISPCTFARWAEGTKRWDVIGDTHHSIWEHRKEYEIPRDRQRPPSPNTHEPRQRKRRGRVAQVDENDGTPLSAACSEYAKTEPSILWSPPPLRAELPHDFYNYKIDRMDPELAKIMHEGAMSTAMSFGFDTMDEVEDPRNFSKTEVDEAVEKYWGLDRTHEIIAEKQHDLAYLRYNEETINASNERIRHEISCLKHENRKLGDCLGLQQNLRDRRIMQHVDKHMRLLEYEAKSKLAEVKARYRENAALRDECSFMKRAHGKLLEKLGKETAKEVFEMFPDVWETLEYRKNRRNFS